VGAGPDRKAPANLRNGELLTGWARTAHDNTQIEFAHKRVCGAGLHTGRWAGQEHSILAFDIDGAAAVEHCLASGCDPQATRTWQTHRNTDPCRLKVKFRLTPEQANQLGDIKTTRQLKEPIKDEAGKLLAKGEALEIFHQPNSQVVVLGEHPTSKGFYFWPDGMGPEDLAPITPQWWALVLALVESEVRRPSSKASSKAPRSSAGEWGDCNPCPICGRNTTNWCSRNRSSGAINCRHGNTFSPELSHGVLRSGQTITGSDGTTYGFCGTDTQTDGTSFSKFVIHDPSKKRNASPAYDPLDGFEVHGEEQATSTAADPASKQGEAPAPRTSKPKERKARPMSHSKAMACLERCVEVQAQRERNSLRRRARLLKAAKDLGLAAFINRQEIAQKVLEAKARCSGEGFKPLTAADRAAMPKPVVRWLVRGLIPANDMTIIGGRPKVGKTRVAVAIVAAVLRGEPFLEFPVAASSPPVLLVTDDQSAGDTADMLTALDLWSHPRLITSEHFRLTEPDLDALLGAIKANPGALVVLDSLRSIGRALQHGENDPEIGATLYDLKQAVIDAGGTLLLIHHCNKAADLVGVEALSGHNAIGGAANTVITLHHCPNEKGLPDKINPQRRLFSEGRSGEGCDLVIDRAASGSFRQVSTFEHWQQQLSEAKKNQKLERLTEMQQQALDALSDSGEWMTRRQVCEAIGVSWSERGRSGEARKVGDSLHRLVELEQVESVRAGTEATFRASGETQKDTVTPVPISDASASQCHEPLRDNRDNRDKDHPPEPLSRLSRNGRDTETDCCDSVARLSRTSRPISAPPAPQPSEPQQVTIHIPTPAPTPSAAPQLLGIGDLVEVANRAYAPKGVFEVIEAEGDKLLIQGPEGHANPMTISIPAAQCEVVF
jgi:hypothetical protein